MMPYTLIRTSRRTLALISHPEKGLIVRAPLRMPLEMIEDFIERKSHWIEKHRVKPHITPPEQGTDTLWYLGASHTRSEFLSTHGISPASLDSFLDATLMEIIRSTLTEIRTRYAYPEPEKIGLKSVTSYWGICRKQSELIFARRLIAYPRDTISAVVAHEMVHMYHPHHQRSFWDELIRICPDYRRAMAPLRHGVAALPKR